MNQDIENIIKKWLKKHKDDGQWVSDYDGEFDLDSCCLDGDFDLNDLADEVLKVVVEKIKEEKEIAVKQLAYETDVEIVEYLKGKENLSNDLLNLLTNSSTLEGEQSEHLSPNKENENNERNTKNYI